MNVLIINGLDVFNSQFSVPNLRKGDPSVVRFISF